MLTLSFGKTVRLFIGYFLGYLLLFLPVLIFVIDGRALVAEGVYFGRNVTNVLTNSQLAFGSALDNARGVSLPRFSIDVQSFGSEVLSLGRKAMERRPLTLGSSSGIGSKATVLGEVRAESLGPPNPFPESEASIVIPKIDVSAPIILSQSPRNRDMLKDLEKGVAHYPESPMVGEQGVAIVLGHSSAYPWYRGSYGSVFSLLNKLDPGEEFIVFYQGKRYTYRASNTKVVLPKDFKVENPDNGSHLILMSCWPVGTNWKRIVVFSDLVSVD